MQVGLLALQGAFTDHYRILTSLGASVVEVRNVSHLAGIDRLIIPGGESTVMTKYIYELGLAKPLQTRIRQGLPTWGICAGCIVLARTVDRDSGPLDTLPITVHRNAYGRQTRSAVHAIAIPHLQRSAFPALFIRAPKIVEMEEGVKVFARYQKIPVFVQKQNVMATTFHPELTEDTVLHEYFLSL